MSYHMGGGGGRRRRCCRLVSRGAA